MGKLRLPMVSAPSLRALSARPVLTRRLWAGVLAALASGLLLLVLSAAPARADSPFSWSPPVALNGSPVFPGISCLPSSLCVGVSGAFVVSSTNPTGGPPAWSYPAYFDDPPEYDESTHAISCTASPSLLCAAVDQEGHVVTSTNPTDAESWHVENLLAKYNVAWGISCPSSSLCVAVSEEEESGPGHGPIILSSVNPTGSQSDWKRVLPLYEAKAAGLLFGISCPSTSFCVAVGQVGSLGGGLLTSNNPTGEAKVWSGASIDEDDLLGVSCASTSLCVTYNGKGTVFTSTEPTGGPMKWNPADIDGENELTGISCTSSPSTLCVATDNQGNVITSTNPTGGPSAWTATSVDAGNRLESVSCASTALCVVSDGAGNILTAPFTSSSGGGGGPTPNPPAPAPSPAPPPVPKKETLKCKKGFKKKTVHGKAKCVKVKKKHKH
jgi:hypothetical protein